MTFKEAYKLPLCVIDGTAWTWDDSMAFMFANTILADEIYRTNPYEQVNIVKAINGDEVKLSPYDLRYDQNNATITIDDKVFIIIRGWGHLTGSGGLNLPEDTATRLQDEFAEYIIKQLS